MDAPAAPLVHAFDLAAFEASAGSDRQARAEDLDRICRDTGFLVLSGHGVPEATIRGVWEAAQRFFAQASGRNRPVEQRVETCHTHAAGRRLQMLKEGGEAADDLPRAKTLSDAEKLCEIYTRLGCTCAPWRWRDLLRRKLAF